MSGSEAERRRPLTPRQRQVREVGGQFLDGPPLAMAHRGGAGYRPNRGNENTLAAFANAVELGYRYIETDVRASADGEAFCFHDGDLSRTVGDERAFADLTAHQVRQFRLRGGESIPTLAEALEAFPQIRFNLDIKTDDALAPTTAVLDQAHAYHRVLVGSFSHARLRRLRRARPQIATSTSPSETRALWLGLGPPARQGARAGALCLQVPLRYRGRQVPNPRVIRAARRQNLQVHVWTIDDADTMNRLFDMGVDGIITDRPEVLRDVLRQRGQWPAA